MSVGRTLTGAQATAPKTGPFEPPVLPDQGSAYAIDHVLHPVL
jgi:hypothetical protein